LTLYRLFQLVHGPRLPNHMSSPPLSRISLFRCFFQSTLVHLTPVHFCLFTCFLAPHSLPYFPLPNQFPPPQSYLPSPHGPFHPISPPFYLRLLSSPFFPPPCLPFFFPLPLHLPFFCAVVTLFSQFRLRRENFHF